MKKTILISSLFMASLVIAQDNDDDYFTQSDYNKWSIELGAGFHVPSSPLAPGYYTDTPAFGEYNLGIRYMMNNQFGARLGFGYNSFENADNSQPFKSNYMRASLEGVANLASVFNFKSWTNTFGLLAHAGFGYSVLSAKEPVDKGNDQMLHGIIGITPQVRLGDRIALFADLSYLKHVRQHYTWDGTMATENLGVNGNLVNLSVGLNIYLGGHSVHADWAPNVSLSDEIIDDFETRISKIETDLVDSDQDGVPDYLDREPNTPSGVAVDTKGRAIDLNKNGIPDELEDSLNKMYVTKQEYNEGGAGTGKGYSGAIEHLLDGGYVNVYFQFNSDKPETYSLDAINYLIKYMKENESATAELIGYADELGNPAYNQQLSERRAKKVHDILIAAGVSADRITYSGGGEDTSVDKTSSPARQLVRRVTFKLK